MIAAAGTEAHRLALRIAEERVSGWERGVWLSVQERELSLLLLFMTLGVWLVLEVGWVETRTVL